MESRTCDGMFLPCGGERTGMKVLLGIGGSDDSLRALDRTLERTQETGDDLTIAVLENPESPRSVEEIEELIYERLDGTGFDAEVVVLPGHPGNRLVEYAGNREFDCITLGSGRTSPLGKVKIGHIAEFVLLNARTSVKLVR